MLGKGATVFGNFLQFKLQFIGMRIATPVCGLVRNDGIFDTFRTDLSAASH